MSQEMSYVFEKVTFSMLVTTIFREQEYWRTIFLIDRHMQL
jgi:hypothetical protein